MKKGILILLLALLVGVVAFFAARARHHPARTGVLLDSMPELAWLRSDLHLTDDQFAKARDLHAAYRPQCAEMCRRIAESQAKLDELAIRSSGMTPELEQAIRNHARVRAECRQRMLIHLYETAALFDEQQAARYLRTVIPAATGSPADAASENPHHH